MRRLAILLAAAAGITALAGLVLQPPAARALRPAPGVAPAVRGAIHVHTSRSDGSGSIDEVAAAAARAGLQFVVLTDHGDATRAPEPAAYRAGVLCIDAVEIATDQGHVVALDLPRAPYPLAGEARDVIEDIRRLGGMSIVAHPGSAKPELQWTDWSAPFDGIEWMNADSEWRDEGPGALARAVLTYPFQPAEALASVLDRPDPVLARWDALAAHRPVVAVAAGDAHARLWPPAGGGRVRVGALLQVPGYEHVFRALSIAVAGVELTGDAAGDARQVLDAIREGRLYSAVDGLAGPAGLSFTASDGEHTAAIGGTLTAGRPIAFRVETNAPPGARVVLLKGNAVVAEAEAATLERTEPGGPGVYRVEVRLPDAPGSPPVPWIVSNPVYVRETGFASPAPASPPPPSEVLPIDEGSTEGTWRIERSARSDGAIDVVSGVEGSRLRLRYALGGTLSESPYVAIAAPTPPDLPAYDRLMFTAQAARPMRISVQLRAPGGTEGTRWHRSVFVDAAPTEITIAFDDMRPRGPAASERPELALVRDLLFVIDTVNTPPGASGQVWIDDVRYVRR